MAEAEIRGGGVRPDFSAYFAGPDQDSNARIHSSGQDALERELSSRFQIRNLRPLGHHIGAVTNELYWANTQRNGRDEEVIVKVGVPAVEPREKGIITENGARDGWLRGRLENEGKMLTLLADNGVPVPSVLKYAKLPDGKEVLVEEKVQGETCLQLRRPNVSGEDFETLERKKGELLAKISGVDVSGYKFGPLSIASERFDTWQEYFNIKVDTALTLMRNGYEWFSTLKHFNELVSSEEEWQTLVNEIGELYTSAPVQDLIKKDGVPTILHGDYWDTNIMASQVDGDWKVTAIDLERGDIGGKSYNLAQWLGWKVGGTEQDPIAGSVSFLDGYRAAGGEVSPDIEKYIPTYVLYQYLEFLFLDKVYGIDRTDEAIPEIKKLTDQLRKIAHSEDEPQRQVDTISDADITMYSSWVKSKLSSSELESGKKRSVKEVFGKTDGIVVGALKLPPGPSFEGHMGKDETLARLAQNALALKNAGVDAILLETVFDRPHPILYRDEDMLSYYTDLARKAREVVGDMPLGVNMLLFDVPAGFVVAKVAGLDFVATDAFANDVYCPKEESYRNEDVNFRAQPALISQFRHDIGADGVLLFAGVNSPYFPKLNNTSFEASVGIAQKYGADALMVGDYKVLDVTGVASIPIIAMGGVKEKDIEGIRSKGYSGVSVASIFESQPGVVDSNMATESVKQIRAQL